MGQRSARDYQFGERFVEMLLADQQFSVSRILSSENGSLAQQLADEGAARGVPMPT